MARDLPPGKRVAVVLFNLGGPDRLEAVQPFLFNLFRDRAIIDRPALLRYPLAALIAAVRAPASRANYAKMGGASPLLPESEKQARVLEAALAGRLVGATVRCFVAMRYWTPLIPKVARDVAEFEPDEVVLLPLYPQFSTTTTASSVKAWTKAYRGPGRVSEVCCYPRLPGFIRAQAGLVAAALKSADRPVRLLFSAHGLPQSVVDGGDPYARQIEATAAAIVAEAGRGRKAPLDWKVCYQSRVGPLPWLGPYTLDCIEEAGSEGLGVVICPIAFVSEHVETLVELDEDYAAMADKVHCQPYIRVPALGLDKSFISALADATQAALAMDSRIAPGQGWSCNECGPICPAREAMAQDEGNRL